MDHWYQVSGVDVLAPAGAAAIVALGDSITDGHASTTNGNDRWTDVLAERLGTPASTRSIGVLNEGIGGNHLLTDGLGPNALARMDRDVLAQGGVRWLILFEGVNDLGDLTRNGAVSPAEHSALVGRILSAYESDRQAINVWVRAQGHFDAVIDFDQVVRDPQQPDRLLPAYDCGDHLHPNPAGYRALGDAIPLGLFAQQRGIR
jgi:lysophospholipase L1-like esterase